MFLVWHHIHGTFTMRMQSLLGFQYLGMAHSQWRWEAGCAFSMALCSWHIHIEDEKLIVFYVWHYGHGTFTSFFIHPPPGLGLLTKSRGICIPFQKATFCLAHWPPFHLFCIPRHFLLTDCRVSVFEHTLKTEGEHARPFGRVLHCPRANSMLFPCPCLVLG